MKQVLYVEDSATAQHMLRRCLQTTCEVTVAETRALARTLVKEHTYDLIIADYMFPDGDSLELIQEIRRHFEPLQLPIIAISGVMDSPLMSRMISAGANECLRKPFNPVEFRTLVERMLSAPYIREQVEGLIGVVIFRWSVGNKYFEFCPSFDLRQEGTNATAVSEAMQAELSRRVPATTNLTFDAKERIATYLIQRR